MSVIWTSCIYTTECLFSFLFVFCWIIKTYLLKRSSWLLLLLFYWWTKRSFIMRMNQILYFFPSEWTTETHQIFFPLCLLYRYCTSCVQCILHDYYIIDPFSFILWWEWRLYETEREREMRVNINVIFPPLKANNFIALNENCLLKHTWTQSFSIN